MMSLQETIQFFIFLVIALVAAIFGLMKMVGGGSSGRAKDPGYSRAPAVIFFIVVVCLLLLVIEARGNDIKIWLVSLWNSILINIVQPIAAMLMSLALV